MERLRVPVDRVAGSSMGSLVAGLLDPLVIGEHQLVDGGLVDNLPIGEARCGWSESSARCRLA